jgi:hypothetical protein
MPKCDDPQMATNPIHRRDADRGGMERRLSAVEKLEAVVSANLKRAPRLRQSILQKAFTGEL